MQSTFSTILY